MSMNTYQIDWKQYAAIARQAVAEGCVLLKNDNNALPLKKGECASVFGRIQFDYYKSGTGSGGAVNTRYVTGILDALKQCPDILSGITYKRPKALKTLKGLRLSLRSPAR